MVLFIRGPPHSRSGPSLTIFQPGSAEYHGNAPLLFNRRCFRHLSCPLLSRLPDAREQATSLPLRFSLVCPTWAGTRTPSCALPASLPSHVGSCRNTPWQHTSTQGLEKRAGSVDSPSRFACREAFSLVLQAGQAKAHAFACPVFFHPSKEQVYGNRITDDYSSDRGFGQCP